MQGTLLEDKVRKIASFNGIDIYRVQIGKFKTNSINFFFQDNLSRENATRNALVPAVLRRGCGSYPTSRDIALRMEELYGASFDCGVTKKGERQIIQFYTEFLSDKYVSGESSQFDNAFGLLYEIVTGPVLENNIFKTDYVEQEKDNLKKLIESRVNDKMQYSMERCLEEMCKDEPFGVYDYGSVTDLKDIGGADLHAHYLDMIGSYPLQVYFAGDMDDAMIDRAAERLSKMGRSAVKPLAPITVSKKTGEAPNVTERMNITQGKLSLGFRTNIAPDSPGYYALMVYNGILGGGIHSKLFQNVREKASLAYYAFSRLEKFKGLMVISSGIEIKNRDRAVEIIMQQLDEIRKGNISDYEFDSTIKTIETGINSLKDSQMQMVDFYLSQTVGGTGDTLDGVMEKVRKVTKKDVAAVSAGVDPGIVYFLTSAEQQA